uniref:MYND-type domain-containing protein n=1 Tax=Grammatophora oceanica TaxID=210454 RepID=A0A7S1VME9_9STRA|mmetsp:Transcript_48685/g.72701  ORF Transcript_48685/g.72701 Transcript_48685/m.72701 type:complete len:276 (+) Transcript_48685:94-921(+)|eukprot:CAMPEP_0194060996 /NCGR_PEP_ID=MMETSP0009_2-20130614/73373_1 /TAXON_ID=210454 /ORGANISM="Grammatophora oceanica, Strain CCMP 410" /LENGTH=275 /DNA_ID=CAMNT_0038712129 /DNA_START=70 /DNA_END=897 /DNA_ORIENTATION=-
MDAEDIYAEREDLMTPEELEEWHHSPNDETVPTLSPLLREWLIGNGLRAAPEASTRRDFDRRKPALGATKRELQELASHNDRLPSGVQQRKLLKMLRSTMLRQLITVDGAVTLEDHIKILENEIETNTPAPVPKWYKYSTVTMGPRKIGYDACCNRGCVRAETVDVQFSKCASCKIVVYCGHNCQRVDWKTRHKYVCKDAAKQREKIARVGKMMQAFSDMSMTKQDCGLGSGGSLADVASAAKSNSAVRERRRQLRAEKKRPKGSKPDGPDPDFF